MQITLEYKLVNSDAWETVRLASDDFFELEPGEQATIDSVPKHNHGVDYLALEPPTVRTTRITIIDDVKKSNRVICETFWNNGQNRVIERTDHGVSEYWEMIIRTRIRENPLTWDILRMGRQDGILVPFYHGIIQRNPDGSETETKMDTGAPRP